MPRQTLNPVGLAQPLGPYSQLAMGSGVKVICISGQVPENENGNLVGSGDFKAQLRQVLFNLQTAVESAGAALADILKITVFVTVLDQDAYEALANLRSEFFGPQPPASTLLQVKQLARPDWMVEIEALAVK